MKAADTSEAGLETKNARGETFPSGGFMPVDQLA